MIRTAVIGVGAMGRNHARIYHELPDVEFVGVVDENAHLAEQTARLYNTTAFTSIEKLFEQMAPEAVTVAVPTVAHFGVVQKALLAGCHVLVEKPIALSIAEGETLVALARELNKVLVVGHIERFNPAVIELRKRLQQGELGQVFQIHTRRLGPFPARVLDVGVIIDLATHDLDIIRHLSQSDGLRVYAETKRHIHTSNEDVFGGLVRFKNDVLGILEINWLTPLKVRELYVTGERGMFVANYLTQDLYFYENAEVTSGNWDTLSFLRGVSEGTMTRFAFQRKEPLRSEQEGFLAAIKGTKYSGADGEDGIAALRLALALIEAGQSNEVVWLT